MPTERMGPAARSFAADAHDCIMVRIQTDLPHTSSRRESAPNGELPSDPLQTGTVKRRSFCKKSPCRGSSSLRVLRRQGAAKTQAPLSGKLLSARPEIIESTSDRVKYGLTT